jgi:hypothetical protein
MDSLIEDQHIRLPSDRKFGFLFAIVFVLTGLYSLYKLYSILWSLVAFLLGVILLAVALVSPSRLRPLNRIWFELGLLLGKVVSPVVLGAIFFLLISPIAILMRISGRDGLRLRKRRLSSYWLNRKLERPFASSFKDQF